MYPNLYLKQALHDDYKLITEVRTSIKL